MGKDLQKKSKNQIQLVLFMSTYQDFMLVRRDIKYDTAPTLHIHIPDKRHTKTYARYHMLSITYE